MYISSFVYDPDAKTIFCETDEQKKNPFALLLKKQAKVPASLH